MQIDIKQYVDNVFRFALSLTNDRHAAEDLTQDCLLRAWSKANQVKDSGATKSWLFQILINIWKDRIKKKEISVSEFEVQELADSNCRPDMQLEHQEETNNILQQMQLLPNQQRSVLFLSAVEQLSNREISSLLQVTENTVKANLSIARKNMRKKLVAVNDLSQNKTSTKSADK